MLTVLGGAVYIWAEGARYEGEYKEDKKNGRGVQTWPSGARYAPPYIIMPALCVVVLK